MKVQLEDGQILDLPFDPADIETIGNWNQTGRRSPLERAAAQMRRDARDVRSASEAARRAAAAAEEAVKAAERAKQAAREAQQAADQARSLAHNPSDVAVPPISEPRRSEPPAPGRKILSVGPGKAYSTPSRAARDAENGDIIEIQSGTFHGDVAVWRADNLIIRGVGGRVVLDAAGKSARGKAIWVIKGDNNTVENIAFTGARVRSRNGAGIRLEGTGLTVRNSEFYDNEMGILTGRNPESEILIEGSRFYRNTVDYPRYKRLGHNIYIGRVKSLTLRFSQVSGAQFGHNVKSRARYNRIEYNEIVDGADGFSSYLLDLHGNGRAQIVGNVFHQSRKTENSAMISIGAENPDPTEPYIFVNNTFVNDRGSGVFLKRKSVGETIAINNIFAGGGTVLVGGGTLKWNLVVDKDAGGLFGFFRSENTVTPGEGDLRGNLVSNRDEFVDPAKMNFRLRKGSSAIDAGTAQLQVVGEDLTPQFQYEGRGKKVKRYRNGGVDIGAYEYAVD